MNEDASKADESTPQDIQPDSESATPKEVPDPVAENPVAENPVADDPPADEEFSDSILAEFWLFLKEEKKWWLAPLILVLLLLSVVIIFAEGSAIAPFIYTIF